MGRGAQFAFRAACSGRVPLSEDTFRSQIGRGRRVPERSVSGQQKSQAHRARLHPAPPGEGVETQRGPSVCQGHTLLGGEAGIGTQVVPSVFSAAFRGDEKFVLTRKTFLVRCLSPSRLP